VTAEGNPPLIFGEFDESGRFPEAYPLFERPDFFEERLPRLRNPHSGASRYRRRQQRQAGKPDRKTTLHAIRFPPFFMTQDNRIDRVEGFGTQAKTRSLRSKWPLAGAAAPP
jgi:hypothetical protein